MPSKDGSVSSGRRASDGDSREAPASLPCCVRPLLQFLFFDMLTAEDGFLDTIRKGGALVGLVIGVMVPFGMLTGSDPATLFSTTSSALYTICGLSTAMAWIVTYLVTRLRIVPVAHALTVVCAYNLASIAVGVPCTADFPLHLSLIQMPIAAAIFNLPFRWLWFAAAGLPYALACYNWSAKSNANPDYPPLFLDGGPASAEPVIDSRMSAHMAQFTFAVVFALTVYAMHDEYAHQIGRSQASATVGGLVAQKLAVYNTEDAREILAAAGGASTEHAEADDDLAAVRGADPALVESLLAIVANLEAYRPHLPNWMVDAARRPATQDTDAATDEASCIEISRATRSLSSSVGRNEDTDSNRSRRTATSRSSSRVRGESDRTPACLRPHAPFDYARTVHLARARLVLKGTAVDEPTAAAAAAAAFVDTVYAAARGTKAAVHSFVGDAVEVSWNAAASVAAPGAKAARFLAAVHAAYDDAGAAAAPRLRVGGGAVLCKGRIQMAGTGVQQALLLSVGEPHARALDVLARAGARHGCMLASKAVAEEGIDVVSCPVARYSVGGDDAEPAHAPAYLILRQRAASEEADEWLYVLNRPPPTDGRTDWRLQLAAAMADADAALEAGDVDRARRRVAPLLSSVQSTATNSVQPSQFLPTVVECAINCLLESGSVLRIS